MRSRLLIVVVSSILLAPSTSTSAPKIKDPEIQKMLLEANALLKDHKVDEAIGVMRKVVELVPDWAGGWGSLSDLERQTGQFKQGLEHAQKAVKLDEKVAGYSILLAFNAYGDQDFDRARECVKKLLKRGDKELGPAIGDVKNLEELLTKQVYKITWKLDPTKGHAVGNAITVALPKTELPYQTATFEVHGAATYRIVKGVVNDKGEVVKDKGDVNDVLLLVPRGKDTVKVITTVTVQPFSYKKQIAKATAGPIPAEARAFLGTSELIDPKSPKIAKIGADLKGKTSAETAHNVLNWMRKNVRYKLDKYSLGELDFKSLDEIIDRGSAECRGYTLLFTALCRAAGVPARPVWGLSKIPAMEGKPKGDFASHNWCEVYLAGCGWIPVDPQKPESFGLQPTTSLRFYMDERKNNMSLENLPMFNLVLMNGDKIEFEHTPGK